MMTLAVRKYLSPHNPFFVGLLLLFLGLILFGNSFNYEFCSDDQMIIAGNPAIRNPNNIPHIWKAFNSRSLTGWSFAVNYRMDQLKPFGYRLTNLLLHVGVSFLVYVLAGMMLQAPRGPGRELTERSGLIALLAALIFLLHPLQTQVVNFITQRTTSLAVLFYLTALICYVKFRTGKAVWSYVLAALAMLLGMFSKEMIITLPLMLTLYECFFFKHDRRDWLLVGLRLLPFYLLAALVPVLVSFDRPDSILSLKSQLVGRPFNWQYFWTEINVLRTYIRMMLLPLHQSHHYNYPLAEGLRDGSVIFSLGVLGAVIGFAAVQFRARRILTFCVIWFFISVAPESLHVCFVNKGVIYDHWVYLAMVGYAILMPVAAVYFLRELKAVVPIFILFLVFLTALSYQRTRVWESCVSLWQDAVTKAPNDYLPYINLGVAQSRRQQYEKAIDSYQRALDLYKGRDGRVVAQILVNLSAVFGRKGNYSREIEFAQKALDWDPNNSQACSNLSLAYLMVNELDKAWMYGEKAIALDRYNADAYNNLGVFYASQENYSKAAEYFRRALWANPGHQQALINFRRVLEQPSLAP